MAASAQAIARIGSSIFIFITKVVFLTTGKPVNQPKGRVKNQRSPMFTLTPIL